MSDKDTKGKATPEPTAQAAAAGQPIVISSGEYRNQQAAQAMAEAAELNMDTTVEGGRYKVGDQWLDANGEPAKGRGAEANDESAGDKG